MKTKMYDGVYCNCSSPEDLQQLIKKMSLLSGIFDGVKKDIRKISKETSETQILVLGAMVEALAEIRQEFTTKVDLFDLPYDRYGAEKSWLY